MRHARLVTMTLLTAVLASCSDVTSPPTQPELRANNGHNERVREISVTGAGRYLLQDVLHGKVAVEAVLRGDRASGRFHGKLDNDGLRVEFFARVTCVSVDPVNHRAWIGGVITRNRSEDPAFQTAIHQPGRDIWFRMLDGKGAVADRTTFLGFEGAAGFATSAAYCAGQPWPDDNARTWALTSGNLRIR